MEYNLLEGGTALNGVTLTFALVGLFVAVAAAVFGRRALFPPRRRLTIFGDRRSGDSPLGAGVRRTTLVFANTGRHAIESTRFDDKQPVVVDLGTPVVAMTITDDRRARDEPLVITEPAALRFGPGLLNPGEYVALQVDTTGKIDVRGLEHHTKHSLVDTRLETRAGRPPSRLRRCLAIGGLALLLLWPVVVGTAQNTRDIRYLLLPRPQAEISPDYGPPGTCVTIRGRNFGKEEVVEIQAFDLPEDRATEVASKRCPAYSEEANRVTSSYTGLVFSTFAIPPGSKGRLDIFLSGEFTDIVSFWVT